MYCRKQNFFSQENAQKFQNDKILFFGIHDLKLSHYLWELEISLRDQVQHKLTKNYPTHIHTFTSITQIKELWFTGLLSTIYIE